ESTPGRMNIFDLGTFRVMVDYAHNADGMQHLKSFLDRTLATRKTGVIGIAGDRRNEDIVWFGKLCAETFDHLIIRHDADLRGRTRDELTRLLSEGIAAADRPVTVEVVSDQVSATAHAIDRA